MANIEKRTIVGEVEVHKVPVRIEVPVYEKVEKPDYVLVKKEIVYQVPRVKYEDKTYELPKYVEKEYIIPKYVEKVYEVPVVREVEKIIEVPVYVKKEVIVPNIVQKEEVRIVKTEQEIKVPKLVYETVKVTNAIISDKKVTNAIIKDVVIEQLHPKYICPKCKKEEINGSQTTT